MTEDEARESLPKITADFNGAIYPAIVSGRGGKFATVSINLGTIFFSVEATWKVVAHCATTGKPLKV